ncbi:MAG: NADH dehydrogenase [Acidobacteria bacterium]|nr:NADH dehydrogenase [Acidobacteriota bacterium]MBW4044383.1 NADH dehydrogenase [Acidobacteriota bacterium]
MTISPALPVALPMLAAAAIAGVRRWLSRAVVDAVAILTAAANLVMCALLLTRSWDAPIVYWFGNWFPRGQMVLGVGFVIDPVGAGLATLAALLMLLALIYSSSAMESGDNHYQPLMLVFLAAMSGFVLTGDLFNLFVFFELMSTAAFALCGLKVEEPAPLQGAFNFAVTNTVGAFFTLTGLAFVYAATGALNMAQIGSLLGSRHDTLVIGGYLFLITGFLIKSAAVPFHFWLADAHAVSPTPVCVLFSGIMVELGLFAILRVTNTMFRASMGPPHTALRDVLLTVGAVSAVWGGAMCFAEHHLKRLLAFSTISHAGAMMMALAVNTPAAIAGWLVYLFAHAMAKSGLFFTAGILLHRLRTMSEPLLFARGTKLRFTAALWLLGGCALAGLPPFAISLGEELTSSATKHSDASVVLMAAFLLSGTLTAAAVFRVFMRVFCGWGDHGPVDRSAEVDELPEMHEQNRVIPARMFVPALLCVLFGTVPFLLPQAVSWSGVAAARMLDQQAYIRVVYGQTSSAVAQPSLAADVWSALLHSLLAVACGAALAAAAVFHKSVPRRLRWASHMEGSMVWMRSLQSGHAGDYVVWTMAGFSLLGTALFLLR